MRLRKKWATARTAEGDMRVFTVRPEGDAALPGLVVIQEAFGVNDHIQDVCRRYAELGYHVASPDLFHRQGVGVLPYDQIDAAKALLGQVSDEQIVADLVATVALLRAESGVPDLAPAVVGYCFGGRCAFQAATSVPDLTAVVVYYGGRIASAAEPQPIELAGDIRVPVLAHFGAEDHSIPMEEISTISSTLEEVGVARLVAVHQGAGHGFTCDARPANFHPEATRTAWAMTTAFLAEAFAGGANPVGAARSAGADRNGEWADV